MLVSFSKLTSLRYVGFKGVVKKWVSIIVLCYHKEKVYCCWILFVISTSRRVVMNYCGRCFIMLTNYDLCMSFYRVFINRVFLVLALVLVIYSIFDSGFMSCDTSLECSVSVEDVDFSNCFGNTTTRNL